MATVAISTTWVDNTKDFPFSEFHHLWSTSYYLWISQSGLHLEAEGFTNCIERTSLITISICVYVSCVILDTSIPSSTRKIMHSNNLANLYYYEWLNYVTKLCIWIFMWKVGSNVMLEMIKTLFIYFALTLFLVELGFFVQRLPLLEVFT